MADFSEKVVLGKTGLQVSRIGIGCSYGIGTEALEEAFERGINYFYFGTLRRKAMARAIHHIAPRHRDQLITVIQSYSRWPGILRRSVDIALKKLRLEYSDILLLGKVDSPPSKALLEEAVRLKETGRVRFLAISAHKRRMFAEYIQVGIFDVIMTRYNAAHTGAETEVFPLLSESPGPGVVCYTATRWGTLLKPIDGERTPQASDCYRFVLRQPQVHVCLCGPKNRAELAEAYRTLELPPMTEEEAAWMRRVGQSVYGTRAHSALIQKIIFD